MADIDLYYIHASPPCRGVLLAAKLIGVDLNLKKVDILKGEQLTPEFLKMNPQHTVPTLDDNGFYLHESRAIITYLFNKYGKDKSLYPEDPQKRALVDQRLFYDIGTLGARAGEYIYPIFRGESPDEEKLKKIEEALGFLEVFLEGKGFAAGDSLTLADAALTATASSLIEVVGVDLSKCPNVSKWYAKMKEVLPDYEEANGQGLAQFKMFYESKILAGQNKEST